MIGRRWVYATLAAFTFGFLVFPPGAFLVVDEERYVSQAVAFAHGSGTVPGWTIIHPPPPTRLISDYPPGTSLLQVPFVWLGGWKLAGLASVVSLIIATLVTMRWLRLAGRHEKFALLIPGFFGAAFFGRLAMSDVPAAALVAATGALLWTAGGNRNVSLAAGFTAGSVLLFREPVALLVAPMIVGSVARGTAVRWALLAGGMIALAVRLVLSELFFDSPLHVRASGYGFSLSSLAHSLPVFAVLLLVMFPLGALLPFAYRGTRRVELTSALALYFGLFLVYEYDSVSENGPAKGIILAARFVVPALPILAFMAGEVWPRWTRSLRVPHDAAGAVARMGASGVLLMAAGVHVMARHQEAVPAALVRSILDHTSARRPVVTNSRATLKYLSPAYAPRQLILRYDTPADSIVAFTARYGGVDVALLDRSDSELFRAESRANDAFLQAVGQRCEVAPAYDSALAWWARLRVARISNCR